MKVLFALLLTCNAGVACAQSSLPLIKADSRHAVILEGEDDRHSWQLSPETRPDVFIITKSPGAKRVTFCTDTDSISARLRPGEHFDFIVLYQGKDSCYTRLESPATPDYSAQAPGPDTIPFVLTEFNNIKIKAVLNDTDTLDLKFDSGTTGLLLTRGAIKNKIHLQDSINPVHSLQIGALRWDRQRVYPVALSGQGTDGRFGWDLFDGRIVEIDYGAHLFIVHNRLPRKVNTYQRFQITYSHTLFYINGELQQNNSKYPARFLFDNGYQRTAMLDTAIMREQQYPANLPVIKRVVMKDGQGREIPVLTVDNEQLNLGKLSLRHVPVQLMTGGNPSGFKTHILGNEVLKRFDTLLDFRDNAVYLKPNSLYDLPYAEAQ